MCCRRGREWIIKGVVQLLEPPRPPLLSQSTLCICFLLRERCLSKGRLFPPRCTVPFPLNTRWLWERRPFSPRRRMKAGDGFNRQRLLSWPAPSVPLPLTQGRNEQRPSTLLRPRILLWINCAEYGMNLPCEWEPRPVVRWLFRAP